MNIYIPFMGMMLLTFVVWVYMYFKRFSWVFSNKELANEINTPLKLESMIPEQVNYPSWNLKNLFELPLLFYALCLYLSFTNQVDNTYVILAWGFFIFRCCHSVIHCTINLLPLRFMTYLCAALCLWVMLFRSLLFAI